jgi:hypothetical protein
MKWVDETETVEMWRYLPKYFENLDVRVASEKFHMITWFDVGTNISFKLGQMFFLCQHAFESRWAACG